MSAKDDEKKEGSIERVGDIPVRSAEIEFKSDEMVKCDSCGRSTPPNRLDCLYCGADLSGLQASKLKPALRPPDNDEAGFDLVLLPGSGKEPSPDQLRLARSITRLEDSDLTDLFKNRFAAPLARTASKTAVNLAIERLREAGVKSKIVQDREYQLESHPRRLRGLAQNEDGRLALILFNNDEVKLIRPEDVLLIVTGKITEHRVEETEKHKRKRPEKTDARTESTDDEVFIDLYTADTIVPFRIQPTGFDYSFLGAEKELVVAANVPKTIRLVRDFAPDSRFDDNYNRLRSTLDKVWPPEEHQDTKGIKRRGIGKFEKERLLTSSNVEQFTKYSRLQWLVRED